MTILDSNGLIYCLTNHKDLPDGPLLVSEELEIEYETALVVNGHRTLELQNIIDLPGYDEVFYLQRYAHYLNTFNGVDISSMRSITDASILALIACVLENFGGSQQLQLDLGSNEEAKLTVITNDQNLCRRIEQDFGDQVEIKNPETI